MVFPDLKTQIDQNSEDSNQGVHMSTAFSLKALNWKIVL